MRCSTVGENIGVLYPDILRTFWPTHASSLAARSVPKQGDNMLCLLSLL